MTALNLKPLFTILTLALIAISPTCFGQTDSTASTPAVEDEYKTYAYHQECSLTTSNSSRKWCTEVTLERIILQHYSWPAITDSSTFENREKYILTIEVDEKGEINNLAIKGGTNETVNQAILRAVKSAGLSFIPALHKGGQKVPFTFQLKLRAFDFMSRKKGPDELQVPQELPEEEQEKINQDRNLTQYRMN